MFDNVPAWAKSKADLAVDLGTANTIVVARSAGVVFEQSTVCCFDDDIDAAAHLYTAGCAAKRLIGREVKQLRTVRPLRNGVLVDVAATRELLKFAIKPTRARGRLSRPRAIIGVPSDATQAERRALTRAAYDAGLAEPLLIAEPILAAIGLGMDVEAPRGRMIVDCGAGTTDVVVLSLGGICASKSVRGGGDGVDAALLQHLHMRRHFQIGHSAAEVLKMKLSEALALGTATHVEVRGLDTKSGLPRLLELEVGELSPILEEYAAQVTAVVRAAFAKTPPDLAIDILDDGIALTGGAALTALVAERIADSTGLRVYRADDPRKAVSKGLQVMLDD
jgi:rod shape-determining protein MreB